MTYESPSEKMHNFYKNSLCLFLCAIFAEIRIILYVGNNGGLGMKSGHPRRIFSKDSLEEIQILSGDKNLESFRKFVQNKTINIIFNCRWCFRFGARNRTPLEA